MATATKQQTEAPARVPTVTDVEPPAQVGLTRRAPIHSDDFIGELAKRAGTRWASNGLTYKTRSAAQGALQDIKTRMVALKLASNTGDLKGRVWEQETGVWLFALVAKSAVNE